MKVVLYDNYGPAKAGVKYQVVENGVDHYVIRCQGKRLVVHKCLVRSPFDTDYFNDNSDNESIIPEDTLAEYR